MSQIFVLGLSFNFMSKNRQLYDYLFEYFFSKFDKKRTRTYIDNLRHSSLHSNVLNLYRFGLRSCIVTEISTLKK